MNIFRQSTEVITDFRHATNQKSGNISVDTEQTILELLRRRPCTDRDIASALSLHSIEVAKLIGHMVSNGAISRRHQQNMNYYSIAKPPDYC